MPLARIVTRFPESSSAASDYFRSRGYTVEVVDPGDFRVTPAVVELKLGKCTEEEALAQAQEAVRRMEAPEQEPAGLALVSDPGDERGEAIAYDIAGRPVVFAERRKTRNSFGAAFMSLLRRAWEDTGSRLPDALRAVGIEAAPLRDKDQSATAEREADTPAAQSVVLRPAEADALSRAAAEREATEREERARLAAQEAEERERVRLRQESEAAAERGRQRAAAAELARDREQERLAAQRAAEERFAAQRAAEERVRVQRETEERVRAQRQAEVVAERERQRVAAARAAEIARRRELQNGIDRAAVEERARLLREAEASAERERQRINAIRERELAAEREQSSAIVQRTSAEEARMRAAGELTIRRDREAALAREVSQAAERKRLLESAKPEPKMPREDAQVFGPMWPRYPEEAHGFRRRNNDLPPRAWERKLNPVREKEWKKAFAAAAAVAVLVAAGLIAFANRRPASPLSPEDVNRSERIQQQAPFGGATIAPAPATAAQPAVKPAPAVVPTIQKPAPVHPAINHSAAAPRRPANNATGGRLRRPAPENDKVAEDQVVVRHFQKPQSVMNTAVHGGIKQISDLH